jgi:hypothetical protein
MGFSALTTINAVGINVATGFADNSANFTIDYSGTGQHIVYIEDFYDTNRTDIQTAVDAKFAAVGAHIDLAAGTSATGQFVWTFASGYSGALVFPIVGLAVRLKSERSDLCDFRGWQLVMGRIPVSITRRLTTWQARRAPGSVRFFSTFMVQMRGWDPPPSVGTLVPSLIGAFYSCNASRSSKRTFSSTPTSTKYGGALASVPNGPSSLYSLHALLTILTILPLAAFV